MCDCQGNVPQIPFCEREHKGLTTTDNNSWNSYDDEGQMMLLFMIFAIVFFVLGGIVLIVLLVQRGKKLPAWILFVLFTIAWITLVILANIHAAQNPISMSYALNSLVTPLIRTPSVLDPNDVFPQHIQFQEHFNDIKQEVLNFARDESKFPLFASSFGGMPGIASEYKDEKGETKTWRFFLVMAGNEFTQPAKDLFPTLSKLVEENKDKVMLCAISLLPPKVKIVPHRGYSKAIVRYMLPIQVPPTDCFICINGKQHTWTEGQSFAFDDNFVHSVYNNSNETRINLFIDVLRDIPQYPILSSFMQSMYKWGIQNSDAVKNEVKRTEYTVDA